MDMNLMAKIIDKADFLILHDKSYNPEACQHSAHWTLRILRLFQVFSGFRLFPALRHFPSPPHRQ